MRIGVILTPCSNAYYRAVDPVKAMAMRGHDVAWPDELGAPDLGRLLVHCDVVHVYRRHEPDTQRRIAELIRRIGIAPLSDIPGNRTRSNVKLKEYAGCGVPWLASPIGPYAGFGENQGGWLVPDDQWFEALERLVVAHREREQLARSAAAWAKGQTIDAAADRWERLFAEAADGAGSALPDRGCCALDRTQR